MKYLDFDVAIEPAADGYSTRVFNSPVGQAAASFTAPFSDLEIENFLLRVGRSRHAVRRIVSPEMASAKAFGGRLFDRVFTGDVRGCLRSAVDEAGRIPCCTSSARFRQTDRRARRERPRTLQEFESFSVSRDGRHAQVRMTEVWSSNIQSVLTRQCIKHQHEYPIPQTVYMELTNRGWIIFDSDMPANEPPYGACH
jgi:hypothetical protein